MSDAEIRLTEEELKTLQALERGYHAITKEYGELEYQKNMIVSRQDALKNSFTTLEDERIAHMNSLTDKYGAGTVDINTGLFRQE